MENGNSGPYRVHRRVLAFRAVQRHPWHPRVQEHRVDRRNQGHPPLRAVKKGKHSSHFIIHRTFPSNIHHYHVHLLFHPTSIITMFIYYSIIYHHYLRFIIIIFIIHRSSLFIFRFCWHSSSLTRPGPPGPPGCPLRPRSPFAPARPGMPGKPPSPLAPRPPTWIEKIVEFEKKIIF